MQFASGAGSRVGRLDTPRIEWVARCEDGPFEGSESYAANYLGCTVTFSLPPSGDDETYCYRVRRLASGMAPALLAYVAPTY